MRSVLRDFFTRRRPTTWVVYDHPVRPSLMYPDLFVARKWHGKTPTSDILTGGSHRELLLKLPAGMTRRERGADDDPAVVEVWS